MQDKLARRNWPALLFVSIAVREHRLFRHRVKHPVASIDFSPRPFPARFRPRAFLDIGVETLLRRHPFMILPLAMKRIAMPPPLCVVRRAIAVPPRDSSTPID